MNKRDHEDILKECFSSRKECLNLPWQDQCHPDDVGLMKEAVAFANQAEARRGDNAGQYFKTDDERLVYAPPSAPDGTSERESIFYFHMEVSDEDEYLCEIYAVFTDKAIAEGFKKGLKARTCASNLHCAEINLPGGRFRTVYAVNGYRPI